MCKHSYNKIKDIYAYCTEEDLAEIKDLIEYESLSPEEACERLGIGYCYDLQCKPTTKG